MENRDSEVFSKLRVSIEDTNRWSGASTVLSRIPKPNVEDSDGYGVFVVKNNLAPVEVDGKIYQIVSGDVSTSVEFARARFLGS